MSEFTKGDIVILTTLLEKMKIDGSSISELLTEEEQEKVGKLNEMNGITDEFASIFRTEIIHDILVKSGIRKSVQTELIH